MNIMDKKIQSVALYGGAEEGLEGVLLNAEDGTSNQFCEVRFNYHSNSDFGQGWVSIKKDGEQRDEVIFDTPLKILHIEYGELEIEEAPQNGERVTALEKNKKIKIYFEDKSTIEINLCGYVHNKRGVSNSDLNYVWIDA